MEKAIEKAIKNGFNPIGTEVKLTGFSLRGDEVELDFVRLRGENKNMNSCVGINYYELIFGTDFIECLVGKGNRCSYFDIDVDTNACEENCGNIFDCASLESLDDMPNYHRAQMSSLKDIDAIKEYIKNNLTSGG